ncbi:hypothetical protein F4820DRAFT_162637 [Hypoxylon rubiginosum]|uniref:Uncharacterized protein n=1 Tax=Hypoxylon rubiginosum TaxID=110542 RepID=A0ACB9Z9L6_9PEZI|nr:hypothetical protein F4820DRAFT_162637 [Hypoxylon rubiginosum]
MTQLGIITEFDGLWDPIVGASDGHGRLAAPTPDIQLERTLKLKDAYTDLKAEVLEEIGLIDSTIIRPAADARDFIAPLRKTIKKRENKRLDFERCQDKVNKMQRKGGRTAKEDAALAKAEGEVARTADEFNMADSHLRETLPPLVTATFSIIPPLIAGVVMIQNRLLGLYYTTLHNFCQDYSFPSPPPPMESVVSMWSSDYEPVKREVESITCIATGKAVRQPMKLPDEPSIDDNGDRKPSTSSAVSIAENGFRRSTSGLISNGNVSNGNDGPPLPGPRPVRIPSSTSIASSQASNGVQSRPSFATNLNPTDFTKASRLGQTLTPTPAISPGSTQPRQDYFGRPSTASTTASNASFNTAASGLSMAVKKKPPPPPPKKKISSNAPAEFVIAQYPFSSQNAGDLSFREGDRIKIVKKTGTDQDWWQGELDGVKGSFPANYCRAA